MILKWKSETSYMFIYGTIYEAFYDNDSESYYVHDETTDPHYIGTLYDEDNWLKDNFEILSFDECSDYPKREVIKNIIATMNEFGITVSDIERALK